MFEVVWGAVVKLRIATVLALQIRYLDINQNMSINIILLQFLVVLSVIITLTTDCYILYSSHCIGGCIWLDTKYHRSF